MIQADLGISARRVGDEDSFLAGVEAVFIDQSMAQPMIYAATRPGGAGLSAWQVAPVGVTRLDTAALPGGVQVGQGVTLSLLEPGGQGILAATGVNDAGLWAFARQETGHLAEGGFQPMRDLPADLAVVCAQGGHVYGSRSGSRHIEVWEPGAPGTFGGGFRVFSGLEASAAGITALKGVRSGGNDLLLALTDGPDALATYTLAPSGRPALADRHGLSEGLGISMPSALEVAEVGGRTYAVVGARGSSSLSVFEIGPGGGITVTDHLLDRGDSRFGGAAHLAVAGIDGMVFVTVAGTEDGISLFQLLPGGRLLHLSTLADRADLSLDNISALDMMARDGALGIAASSATEPGLTWISPGLGALGETIVGDGRAATLGGSARDDVLAGGAGNERLVGGAGNDVLMDGAGRDTLSGGEGADTFIFHADGEDDRITDFQVGIDRIDLSGWVFLRNPDQLTFRSLPGGGEITFRSEVLEIETRSGAPLTAAQFADMVLLDGDRLLPQWSGLLAREIAEASGGGGNDLITGGGGRDTLTGGAGADTLMGGAGDDHLDGGPGGDHMNGGPGSDRYRVDHIDDLIVESRRWEGHDTVESSVDFWMRRAHVEDLVLTGDGDIRGVGNGLVNVITGNSGDNILDGGRNNDRLIGGAGNDTYFVRAPRDTVIELADGGIDLVRAFRSMRIPDNVERMYLQGTADLNGIGNDDANLIVGNMGDNILAGRGGRDTLKGLGGSDTFVFDRQAGRNNVDRIIDFTPGEDAIWIKAALFGLLPGALPAGAFQPGRVAENGGDRVIYDDATGALWVDPDGTGPQRQMLTFILEGDVTLDAQDIWFF
ncbi:M10 family metallopeptidase C-terminal domain-containing protein [Oceaniglobus trochenteri]|uniref:M10 family metallopeptidase C-terminal domain-containing protein n=1 Tax=Oceaniglobus trochenteri TaxID=2763260 RepID=UPI001CFFA08A|nr:hypothetical protein [Oceaniglobus trochenteri]